MYVSDVGVVLEYLPDMLNLLLGGVLADVDYKLVCVLDILDYDVYIHHKQHRAAYLYKAYKKYAEACKGHYEVLPNGGYALAD